MPRTFDADFNTEKNRPSEGAEPFLMAKFNFSEIGAEDLWIVDRGIKALGTPPTILGDVAYPLVIDPGIMGSTFGRQADGELDVQRIELKLDNKPVIGAGWPDSSGARLSDSFRPDFDLVAVDFYWCWLKPGDTVVRAIATSGFTRSPTRYGYKTAQLSIGPLFDRYFMKEMLVAVEPETFPSAPEESFGKHVALAIGDTDDEDVGGARIPAVKIEKLESVSRFTPRWVACENHSDLPVDSIGPVYWDGHKLNEENIAVDTSDDSESMALNVMADGVDGASPFSGDFYGVWGSHTPQVRNSDGVVKLGGDAPDEPYHLIQMIRFRRRVRISAVAVAATYHQHTNEGNEQDRRPLVLGITDQETGLTGGGGGLTNTVGSVCGDLTKFMVRSSSHAMKNEDFDYDLSEEAFFNLPSWEPIPNKWYAFVWYYEGFGNCGFPADSSAVWYHVGLGGHGVDGPDEFDPSEFGDAYTMHDAPDRGTITPQSLPVNMTIYGYELGRDSGIADAGFAADGDLGAWGLYATAVEPEDATAVGGITVWLKARATGTYSGTAYDLKGSLSFELYEIDAHDNSDRLLASAEFNATDYNGTLNPLTYTEAFEEFDQVALLEKGKRYELRTQGKFDADGQYQGWITQGISFGVFLKYKGAGPTNPTKVGAVNKVFYPPTPPKIGPIDAGDSVAMRVTLHAVKFERRETDTLELPMRCATISPYLRHEGNESGKDWVPDGVQLSTDITCLKTRPDDVFHGLANRAGCPDARIDLAGTFAASATKYGTTYKMRGAVVDQQSYKQFFTRAAFEMRSNVDWEADKLQLKWIPLPTDAVTLLRTFGLEDIKRVSRHDPTPRLEIERTDENDIINAIRMLYRKDFSTGDFFDWAGFRNAAAIAANERGELRKDELFEMLYIRDPALAQLVGEFHLAWNYRMRKVPIFTVGLEALEVMKDDAVGLDLLPHLSSDPIDVGPDYDEGGYGEGVYGGTLRFDGMSSTLDEGATRFLVRGVTPRWLAREIEFRLLEMG